MAGFDYVTLTDSKTSTVPDDYDGSMVGKYYTRLRIGPYKRPDPFNNAEEFNSTMVVFLPLPTALQDNTTVSYSPVTLETVGDFLGYQGGGLGGAEVAGAAALRYSGGLASKGFNTLKEIDSGVVSAIGGGLQTLFPAEKLSSALQQKYGVAPNPNPSVAFQGPVLRDFGYRWAFYPKNKEESQKIDQMIKSLKMRALPTYNQAKSSILNYPYLCQINFFPWDKDGSGKHGWSSKSILRYKRCFMTSVNVNYNAFGAPAFFEDSELPTTYALDIQFKEVEYLTGEDWDVGAGRAFENERANSYKKFDATEAIKNDFIAGLKGIGGIIVDSITSGFGDAPPDPANTDTKNSNAETQTNELGNGETAYFYNKDAASMTTITRQSDGVGIDVKVYNGVSQDQSGTFDISIRSPGITRTFETIQEANAYAIGTNVYAASDPIDSSKVKTN